MEEIYWITRLGNIQGFFITLTIISGSLIAVFSFALLINMSGKDSTEFQKKAIKRIIPVLIISVLGIVFTPTTKEALMIWGVGGTIDYVKSNETAKQLPDKCLNALDKWVDSLNEEENKKINNMTLNEYQHRAMSTCMDTCNNLTYMLTGLNAEVGEVNDKN